MEKKNWKSDFKWVDGTVNTDDDHIKIVYGDNQILAALIGHYQEKTFTVQFVLPEDLNTKDRQHIIRHVKHDLDFYLVGLKEKNPWAYAIYHCSTAANIYSSVHWGYYPKGYKGL